MPVLPQKTWKLSPSPPSPPLLTPASFPQRSLLPLLSTNDFCNKHFLAFSSFTTDTETTEQEST